MEDTDYLAVLNSINFKLSQILDLLSGSQSDQLLMFLLILFTVFLVFYVMRGE